MSFITQHFNAIMKDINPSRSLAIDVFRGITITAMILVNNPGSWSYVYWPLGHAKWHGWTPTDLIFPFFILIVGMSLSFTLKTPPPNTTEKLKVFKKAVIRGAKLFGFGLLIAVFYYNFLDSNYNWWSDRIEQIRILGVLQRIGLAFIFTAAILLIFRRQSIGFISLLILALYAAMMLFTPYPLPDGNMTAGNWEFGNNFAAYIDTILLGKKHNYYRSAMPFSFDPEGILSTLPTIANCLIGYLIGAYMQSEQNRANLIKRFVLFGIVLTAIAYAINPVIPINKALWTPSYVLLTTGIALLILAALSYAIDEKGWRTWSAPFVVFGANALLFYVGSMFGARILVMIPVSQTSFQDYIFSKFLSPALGPYNGSLAFAMLFLIASYGIMHWLYKKKIFWKV